MQKDFYIYIRLPDGDRAVVGRMLHEKMADGNIQSYFRYDPKWLSGQVTFSLDPVHLPLIPDVFQLKSRTGLWGVFEDALPDAWGRRLLTARHNIDVSRTNNIDLLLLSGWAEPGATGFSRDRRMPRQSIAPMDLAFTDEAIMASETFEKSGGIIDLPDFFISGGSSAGGARPKVLAQSDHKLFIVKFPSITDPGSEVMAHLEFFGLNCVRLAGIPVPEFFLVKASASRLALAIKRFDINGENGRRHFLSMQSLIGIEEQLGLPYAAMAAILRKISVEPEKDIQTLYKQMVVNVLIANCDDHLKNFAMRYDDKAKGYRLSPAYDVVPNLWQQEHILSVAGQTRNISPANLLTTGKDFGFSQVKSRQLLIRAAEAVSMALAESKEDWQTMTDKYPLCQQLYRNIQTSLDNFTSGGS